jgi:glycosyl transferase family 25
MRLQGYCYGTQAYVLTRRGAGALVKSCGRLTMPVDWAMSRYWAYGIDNYAVFPFPVLERLGPSSIAQAAIHDTGPGSTLAVRARRFLWRLGQRATRAWVDLRQVRRPFGLPTDATAAMFGAPETRLPATADSAQA